MKRLLSSVVASLKKSVTSGKSVSRKRQVRLGVERLEGRELMSGAPLAPSFTTTAVSATQINLTWKAVSGATGYYVDIRVNNGAWQTPTYMGTSTTAMFKTLAPGVLYTFDVMAANAAGSSPWASAQNAITQYNPKTSAVNDPYLPAPTYSPAPANATLFGPSGQPSPTDVSQGFEGDCWLLASLAEVAARAPQDIKNMFTYEGTTVENGAVVGLYQVRFFNSSGVAKYVTVDTELPNGGTYYDRVLSPYSGNKVLWFALAEKAYAEANGLGYVTSQHVGVDSYDALAGGYPSWPLQAITGKAAKNYTFSSTNLAAAWNAGDLIVLTSDSKPNSTYIVPTHAYAVVNYNGSSFELLNPWGTTPNGTAPVPNLVNGKYLNVYGEYWFSPAFLSLNFSQEGLGAGSTVTSVATSTSNGPVLFSPDEKVHGEPLHDLPDLSQAIAHFWESHSSQWNSHPAAGLDEATVDFWASLTGKMPA